MAILQSDESGSDSDDHLLDLLSRIGPLPEDLRMFCKDFTRQFGGEDNDGDDEDEDDSISKDQSHTKPAVSHEPLGFTIYDVIHA